MSKTLKEKYGQSSVKNSEPINSKTLTEQRKAELRETLQLIEESVDPRFKKFLLEGFDAAEAQQIVNELDKISALATKYKADELNRAAKEAEKIARKLVGLEGKGSQWLAKSLGKLTKGLLPRIKDVFDFTGLVTQGLKGIAPALKLTVGREMEAKDKSAASLADVLKFNQRDSTKKAMKQAFMPDGFFASLKGVPFLNVDKLIDQLIRNNSFNELVGIKPPTKVAFSKEDYKELQKGLKGDNEQLKNFLAALSGKDDAKETPEGQEASGSQEKTKEIEDNIARARIHKDAINKILKDARDMGVKWDKDYIREIILDVAKDMGIKVEFTPAGKISVSKSKDRGASSVLLNLMARARSRLTNEYKKLTGTNLSDTEELRSTVADVNKKHEQVRKKIAELTGLTGKELAAAIEDRIFKVGKSLNLNVSRGKDRVYVSGGDKIGNIQTVGIILDAILKPSTPLKVASDTSDNKPDPSVVPPVKTPAVQNIGGRLVSEPAMVEPGRPLAAGRKRKKRRIK